MAKYVVNVVVTTDRHVTKKALREMIEVDRTLRGPMLYGLPKAVEVTKVKVRSVDED